jgi:hypothetical protein
MVEAEKKEEKTNYCFFSERGKLAFLAYNARCAMQDAHHFN